MLGISGANMPSKTGVCTPFGLRSMRGWELVVFAVLAGGLCTLLGRYEYGIPNDHIDQFPMALRVLDSSYLKNDFMVNASAEFGPRYFYVRLLAGVASVMPFALACFLLSWQVNTLVVVITWLTARALFAGSKIVPVIACAMVLSLRADLIGGSQQNDIVSPWIRAPDAARPFALVALAAGIWGRPILAALLACASAIAHPLVGLEAGFIAVGTAGVAALFRWHGPASSRSDPGRPAGLHESAGSISTRPARSWSRAARWRGVALALAGLGILGVAAFCFYAAFYPRTSKESHDAIINILARFRCPGQLCPSRFRKLELVSITAFLVAVALAWARWRSDPTVDRNLTRRVAVPFAILLALWGGACFFVEVLSSPLWAGADLFRMGFLVKWLGLMLIGGTVVKAIQRDTGSIWAWAVAAATGRFHPVLAMLGNSLGLGGGWGRLRRSPLGRYVMKSLGVVLIGVAILLGDPVEVLIATLTGIISVWLIAGPAVWHRFLVPLALVGLTGALLAAHRMNRVVAHNAFLGLSGPVLTYRDAKLPEDTVAFYARENTEKDSVFVTPPGFGRFRMTALRAIVVDFVAVPFQDRALLEWKKRLTDCYGEVASTGWQAMRDMDVNYRRITDDRLVSLADKYHASYAVLYPETATSLPVLFRDDSYVLVRIRAPDGNAPPML